MQPCARRPSPRQTQKSVRTLAPGLACTRICAQDAEPGSAAVARQMQEQQLKARQLVLQQQAASATAAASKTQREVRLAGPLCSADPVACTPAAFSRPQAALQGILPALSTQRPPAAKRMRVHVRRCCVTACRCQCARSSSSCSRPCPGGSSLLSSDLSAQPAATQRLSIVRHIDPSRHGHRQRPSCGQPCCPAYAAQSFASG